MSMARFKLIPNSLLVPLLLLLLLLVILLAPTQSTDPIEQICKKTPFYSLCLSTLEPNSQPISTDPKSLTSVMANLILSNATDTLGYIQQLIKQSTDPEQEQDLADCAELYIPVVKYNLPQAIDALSRGRFGFAGYAISDAAKQAEACEKGFSGGGSPLTTRNQVLANLCHVAVAIINTLVKAH